MLVEALQADDAMLLPIPSSTLHWDVFSAAAMLLLLLPEVEDVTSALLDDIAILALLFEEKEEVALLESFCEVLSLRNASKALKYSDILGRRGEGEVQVVCCLYLRFDVPVVPFNL